MNWKEISWILRGRVRKKVLKSLNNKKTATQLSKELDTHRSTISHILLHMEKKAMVKCLDPDQPYNRYYKRMEKGDNIINEIEKLMK